VRRTGVGVGRVRARVQRAAPAALVLVVALATACAVFASKAELRMVEQLRAETDPLERVRMLSEYDARFAASGRMGERIDPFRGDIEEEFWQYAVRTGLDEAAVRAYLDHYPEGRRAPEAQRRLDQLRYFAEADAARLAAKRQAEEDERVRVEEQNERERAKVRGGLERWLRTALKIQRWGTTVDALSAMDETFREQWQGDPAPLCVGNTCRKTLAASYFFAREGSTRVDRSISLVLQVDTREGRVYRLTGYYTGRGFVDWLEMSGTELIEDESEEDRQAAQDAMLAMTQGAVDSILHGVSEIETEDEGVLVMFRRGDLDVTLREFPPTYAAGRVDGFQVEFTGELAAAAAPTVDEEGEGEGD